MFFAVAAYTSCMAQGIVFKENATWKSLLADAKSSNKLIFLDAYTSWCGPCKKMAKEIFPVKEVGEYFNANFVNVKMDMEKGEGVDVAKNYAVEMYPTYLFINGDGEVVHKALGFMPTEKFLDVAKQANDPNKQLISLQKRYLKGEREPKFLYDLAYSMQNANEENKEGVKLKDVFNTYINGQKDWSTSDNMKIIYDMAGEVDSKPFAYMLNNRTAFEKQFGTQNIKNRLDMTLLFGAVNVYGVNADIKEVEKYFKKHGGKDADVLFSTFKVVRAQNDGDWKEYAQAAIEKQTKYPTKDANELNEMAWIFYENVSDKKQLQTALNWALESVKVSSMYYNNDTVAALYYKLKNKKKAKEYAQKAIDIAKKTGDDYSSTQELLKKINGK